MKTQSEGMRKTLRVLPWIIALLAAVAAGTGVLWQGGVGQHGFVTLRGQTVQIWGNGLYSFDSVSGASQEIAQDIVTLCFGIPLLIIAGILAARGSLRGKLLLAGTLGYFLYTYISMSTLSAYNELFLVYVALMSLCLFGFVLSLMAIDPATLPAHFTSSFPRRATTAFTIFLGAMLLLLWLKLIVPPLFEGTPPAGLDNYSTLVIQALDLGVIAPTAILTGVLLLRHAAIGYLLTSVVLVIGFTMGAALLAMSVGQIVAGVSTDASVIAIFTMLALIDMVFTVLLLRSIVEVPQHETSISARPEPQSPSTDGAGIPRPRMAAQGKG